jgi:hypothetical protein
VDYVIVSPSVSNHVTDFEVLPFNELSDHAPLVFRLTTSSADLNNSSRQADAAESEKLYWDSGGVPAYRELLLRKQDSLNHMQHSLAHLDVNEATNEFTNFMYDNAFSVFGKVFKHKTETRRQKSEWFDETCKHAKRDFSKARNGYLHNKSDDNRCRFVSERTKYNKVKKRARKRYKRSEGIRISKLGKGNSKEFWKSVKKLYSKQTNSQNGLEAEDFRKHFASLFDTQGDNNVNVSDVEGDVIEDTLLDSEFSEMEVEDVIKGLKRNKSAGIDGVIAEVFMDASDIIAPFITSLFNKIFLSGSYPSTWGDGILIPLHKKGDVDDVNNYRGVTLISVLAKMYSHLLHNRISKWAENNEKLLGNQFGFQKHKSTSDCIFTFYAIISKVLNAGGKLFCAFVDYEKAFDRVDRHALWFKLVSEGVSTKMVQAVKAIYETVKICIRHNACMSDSVNSHVGVKQGDPLSPLMFMFFINDICENVNSDVDDLFTVGELKVFMLLYADDAVLFATSKSTLQHLLTELKLYSERWNLKVNTGKTKIMVFEIRGNTRPAMYFGTTELEVVRSFKYLGLEFF